MLTNVALIFAGLAADSVERKRPLAKGLSLAMTIGGLLGLVCGGRLTVYAAVKIALAAGIPEFVIGLTIISFGTTLPELITMADLIALVTLSILVLPIAIRAERTVTRAEGALLLGPNLSYLGWRVFGNS